MVALKGHRDGWGSKQLGLYAASINLLAVYFFLLFDKKLLGAPGLTTRSKDATRGSWPCHGFMTVHALCWL